MIDVEDETNAPSGSVRNHALSKGFSLAKLSDVASIQSGGTPSRTQPSYWAGGSIPWITTSEVNGSIIRAAKQHITPAGLASSSAKLFPAGTVLVAMYGQGKTRGQAAILGIEAATNQACAAILPGPDLTPEFLFQYLDYSYGALRNLSNSGGQDNLSATLLADVQVPVPPLQDQHKIAAVLEAWDRAIDINARLVNSQKRRLEFLRAELLGRNGEFPLRWPLKSLGELSTPIKRKVDDALHPVMTISAKAGFILQSDKYSRDMAGKSLTNYTLLLKGDFAYNKGNSLTFPQGCVFSLPHDSALVPSVYYSFRLHPDLDRRFYEHLFASGALNRQLARVINSGVRNDGLLNLDASDFFGCRVPVPPRHEQELITKALDAAARESDLIQRRLFTLKSQKRGIMQKILFGAGRISPFSSSGQGIKEFTP